jgi:hypothetical protein
MTLENLSKKFLKDDFDESEKLLTLNRSKLRTLFS